MLLERTDIQPNRGHINRENRPFIQKEKHTTPQEYVLSERTLLMLLKTNKDMLLKTKEVIQELNQLN